VSAQMIGPASSMITTTTIQVGKSFFAWVDKGVLSSSARRVADYDPTQQEGRHHHYLRQRSKGVSRGKS
jgi:hypothetical protein